ncbi:MAG: pilus assembly protein PilM [Myxococcales bacterium]|jgi:general secretion pathway protein L
MARILGLDIGARSVKALLLESSFRGFTVRSFTEARLDEETGLKGALASLQANKHLAADQVVVAVPGCGVATQVLTLPFTDARRIEATIGFEVEGQLPYDLSEVVYDFQPLGSKDGKTEVLVGTVRNEVLAELLETLREAGVDPRVVTAPAIVYQNVFAAGGSASSPGPASAPGAGGPAEGAEAIIDLGHERSSICIGRAGGGLEYARTFVGGGRDLTRAIANEFKVSLTDAEVWKETEGDVTLGPDTAPEMERAVAALLRGLAPIIREIRATLRAHQARFRTPLARCWITGGTARLKGLAALLSRELGVEVRELDAIPGNGGSPVPAESRATAGQAFALAMRGHGLARAGRFNLRKGEFAFKGDLDYLRGKVSRLAAFAAVLALLAGGYAFSQLHVLGKREKVLDDALCEMTTRVLGQCQRQYEVALNMLKGTGSPVASLPTVSALDLFAELTNRAEKTKVKVNEVDVQLERIRLRGETESFEGVDQLVGALGEFKCFEEIKRGRVQKSRDGSKVEFDLDIHVDCAEKTALQEGA